MLFTQNESSAAGDAVMRAMFEARKRVFVDLLGWDVPVLAGKYELDQFDDTHARYLILADSDQNHLASARLLPTTRPHILDTLYAELSDSLPPTGPATWEITRFCLDRSLRAAERRRWRDALVTGLAHYALDHHITTYTGVAEQGWLEQILAFGWNARLLGTPKAIDGMKLGALRIDIEPETPALLAANGILPATQIPQAEAA
ncbi:GNAT family N-acetyltransferase [Sphingomonas psychrotolerans]|uniref:Acyl-homoserine-lactone synthase n=1 Tax=Sphingomonas psychrotolerans TaxID=1327635 RepID=A0ABU3N8B8_9SPHN|nr:acyl-homoserine-lactone synthase [Sphingomonas psychrotolerans]MDT8760551.1 GNAT family N-acetyltransferase [Sphingomonas psychrotolerans]